MRTFRTQLDMTVAELATQAGLSPGMLSKIENGLTSPSLATLKALSQALNVPVTAFFRKYEEERDVSFVRKGRGLTIERRGNPRRPPVSAAGAYGEQTDVRRALPDLAD